MMDASDPVLVRDVSRIRHLLDAEQLAYVLDAIIAGNTPAQAWADDAAAPRTALVWDRRHSVYLGGAVDRPDGWRGLLDREVAPAGQDFVKVHAADAAARTVFAGCPLERRERVLYRRDRTTVPNRPAPLPDGFRISAIGDRWADLGSLAHFGDVVAEIESCWRSVDDFRRSGFGFVAHDAETIVCWCTAEYVSDRRCGTGIETVAAYGGRGFATLTASAFVDHCAERGLTPYWDAWTSNRRSVAVAEKVGFHRVETYSILVGSLPGARAAGPSPAGDGER